MDLWDYCSHERNVILKWADDVRLSKRDRALLDQKLDALSALQFDLAQQTHLLTKPLNNSADKHIHKLRVNASIMVRIMVCRGPMPGEIACTLLAGATERDGKLTPERAVGDASIHRRNVIGNPDLYRKEHERFTKTGGNASRTSVG